MEGEKEEGTEGWKEVRGEGGGGGGAGASKEQAQKRELRSEGSPNTRRLGRTIEAFWAMKAALKPLGRVRVSVGWWTRVRCECI